MVQPKLHLTHKARYLKAHADHFQHEYPAAWAAGHYCGPVIPDPRKSNGLTTFIINYCNWTGNYANRINVAGRMVGKIVKTESGAMFDDRVMIKSSTRKGSEDIDCIINKMPVKIEVKIGRDYQRPKQVEHQKKVERAGGKYFIVKTVEDFFWIYDSLYLPSR